MISACVIGTCVISLGVLLFGHFRMFFGPLLLWGVCIFFCKFCHAFWIHLSLPLLLGTINLERGIVAGFAPADGLTVALTVSLTARW